MTQSQASAMAAGGIIGAYAATASIFAIVYLVFRIIAYWKIFEKAGRPGWKSIIPIYHDYVSFDFTWNTKMFWVYLVSTFLMTLFSRYANNNMIFTVLTVIFLIVTLVVVIRQLNLLAKSFGYGVGFTVGLVLLYPIFILILGFGSAKYLGNKSE